MIDVSVILVNYNTCDLTLACIDSIFEMTKDLSFEVVVVDNNSHDRSREVLGCDRRISYHYLDENLGFGKANNYGTEHSTGKYVFFLNSDTLLRNNAIKHLFDYCERHAQEHLGGVGCMLEDENGKPMHSYGHFPTLTECLTSRFTSPLKKILGIKKEREGIHALHPEAFDVDYITGADLFVNRDVIDRLGGFDPDFFMYYEETEMQRRYARNGYRSRVICAPRIAHLEGASFKPKTVDSSKKQGKVNNRLCFTQRSNYLYIRKCYPRWAYRFYRGAFYLIRLPFLLTLGKEERHIYHKLLLEKV